MRFISHRGSWGAMLFALFLVLSGCANLDRKITGVTLKPGAQPAPIAALALVFITPDWADRDPGLAQGYRMSGVMNDTLMKRTTDRAAEFMTLNGVRTTYAGSFGRANPLGTILRDWSAKGYSTMVFVPTGATVSSQNGVPVYASIRYRVMLYDQQLRPVLELFDEYSATAITTNQADTAAAGWINALTANGYAVKKGDKLLQPPYRDFVREENERKAAGK